VFAEYVAWRLPYGPRTPVPTADVVIEPTSPVHSSPSHTSLGPELPNGLDR
jgi:hypothetical protein